MHCNRANEDEWLTSLLEPDNFGRDKAIGCACTRQSGRIKSCTSIDSWREYMSAPSRRPEIRRRRTRKEKIVKLRKRLAAAGAESERSQITAKLGKFARRSPGQPLVKA